MRLAPHWLLLTVCVGISLQTGCVTFESLLRREKPTLDTKFMEAQGYSIPPGGMPSEISQDGSTKPSVVLEVRGEGKSRHVERIPLPLDRGVFIEEIVQQAKLHERIGKLQVNIMRPNGEGAPPVRLELYTDEEGRSTNLGTNYALLPGDHIIVNEDKTSALSKIFVSPFTKG